MSCNVRSDLPQSDQGLPIEGSIPPPTSGNVHVDDASMDRQYNNPSLTHASTSGPVHDLSLDSTSTHPSLTHAPTSQMVEPLATAQNDDQMVDHSQQHEHGSSASLGTHNRMVTRSVSGVFKRNPKYANLHTTSFNVPKEPKSEKSALQHPGWLKAMHEELSALSINQTWDFVPRTANMNVVGCKLQSDGSLERLKARLLAKGFNKVGGVDFSGTFSPY